MKLINHVGMLKKTLFMHLRFSGHKINRKSYITESVWELSILCKKCRNIEAMMWEMNLNFRMWEKHCMKCHGKNI